MNHFFSIHSSQEENIEESKSLDDLESQTNKTSVGTNTNNNANNNYVFLSSMKVKKRTLPSSSSSSSASSLSLPSPVSSHSTTNTLVSISNNNNNNEKKSNSKISKFYSNHSKFFADDDEIYIEDEEKNKKLNKNDKKLKLKMKNLEVNSLNKSITSSYFILLDGILEMILKYHILNYLSASDLLKLSRVSRYFYRITQSPSLWSFLYTSDFLNSESFSDIFSSNYNNKKLIQDGSINPPGLITTTSSTSVYYSSSLHHPSSPTAAATSPSSPKKLISDKETSLTSKQIYIIRYQEYQNRLIHSNREKQEMKNTIRRITYGHSIENLLDLSQVRFLPPLILSSIFLSLVLYCQKIDGLKIPYWAAAVPLSVSLFYSMINLCVVRIVHRASKDSEDDNNMFKNMWENMQSPLVYIYKELLGEETNLYYTFLGVLGLMVAQLALVILKLTMPEEHRDNMSWGCAFLPVWIFFGLFLVSPCTKFQMNFGVFILSFFVFWIPLFILFVCLATKYDSKENMRLSLIFIPFYVVEGLIMLSTLMVFISGIYRFRKGLIDKIDEYIAIFLVSWAILSPLVVFEALLSVRDEYQITGKGPHISATESVTPLLILLGWFTLIVTYLSCTYKTKFNENRERSLEQAAGLTVIHSF